MATKKVEVRQPKRRVACVYNRHFYEGATVKEAYEECDSEEGVSVEECEFYELRELHVQMQIIERPEPVVVG
jgi:hypothetical protein